MATSLTQLRTQARQKADMINSAFCTDAEVNDMLNLSYAELYDILVSTYEDYYFVETTFTVQSGSVYELPADFYKLRGIDLMEGGAYYNIPKYQWAERNAYDNNVLNAYAGYANVRYRIAGSNLRFYPEQSVSGRTFRLFYIPRYTPMIAATPATLLQNNLVLTAVTPGAAGNLITLTITPGALPNAEVVTVTNTDITVQIANGVSTTAAVQLAIAGNSAAAALVTPSVIGSGNSPQVVAAQLPLSNGVDDGTADGISGWEEIIILDTAIKMLAKEESNTSVLMQQKTLMLQRIKTMGVERDAALPERITDVYNTNRGGIYGTDWGY